MNKITGYKYSSYLIGAMSITAEKDGGIASRIEVEKELLMRNVFSINPAKLEAAKTGISAADAIEKIIGWVASGKRDLLHETGKSIWKGHNELNSEGNVVHIGGDLDYVKVSDWLTFILKTGDKPCVIGETKVLMDDLSTKYIKDIKKGDKIKGFVRNNGKTRMETSEVLGKYYKGFRDTLEIIDDKGNKITCTPDHKFLTRNKKKGSIYTEISNIEDVFSIKIQDLNPEFYKGWITGYLQHDGNYNESKTTHRITCLSDKKEEILKVKEILEFFGFTPRFRIVKQNNSIYYETSINKIREYNIIKYWKINASLENDFMCGWLAGSIDADGYYEKESLRYTQSLIHDTNIRQFELYCKCLDIKYSKQIRKSRISFIRGRKIEGSGECTVCLSKIHAFKLISLLDYKREKLSIGTDRMNSYITSKTKSKKQEVYDISTSTGNFVAEGFIVHNCGTYFEIGVAIDNNIPIYLITNIAKRDLPQSLILGIEAVGGEFFENLNQYLNFIDEKYKLKRKELKEEKQEETKDA